QEPTALDGGQLALAPATAGWSAPDFVAAVAPASAAFFVAAPAIAAAVAVARFAAPALVIAVAVALAATAAPALQHPRHHHRPIPRPAFDPAWRSAPLVRRQSRPRTQLATRTPEIDAQR